MIFLKMMILRMMRMMMKMIPETKKSTLRLFFLRERLQMKETSKLLNKKSKSPNNLNKKQPNLSNRSK